MRVKLIICGCFIGAIILFCWCVYPVDTEKLTAKDEQLVTQILSIEDIKQLKPSAQKKIFEQIQYIIGRVQKNPVGNKALIRALCEKQLAFFPFEKKAYIDFATYYYRIEDFQKVVEYSNKALSSENIFYLDPRSQLDVTAYTFLGQNELENNKLTDAYEYLNQALLLDSQIVQPFYLMGNVCFKLEKFSESLNAYEVAFSRNPELAYPIDYFFFALGLHRAGSSEKAEQILVLGVLSYPNEEGMHLNLGFVLRAQNKLFEALLEFQMEKFLFGPAGRFYKSANLNADTTEELIKQRKKADEYGRYKHIVQWQKYMDKKNYSKAVDELLIIKQDMKNTHWVVNLFLEQTYFSMKDYTKALRALDEMRASNPGIVLTALMTADIYLRLDNIEQARKYYERAKKIAPDNIKVRALFKRINKVTQSADNESNPQKHNTKKIPEE